MRPEKHGSQRTELSVALLDEAIAEDAFVRVIDLFVDRLGNRKTRNLNPDWLKNIGFFIFSLCAALWWLIMSDKQSLGAYLPGPRRMKLGAYQGVWPV
ncbi:MAG: hypothetical protein JNK77_02670 [Saprospiraceae bacterium]|nr:hypothetical protein [Saprospiraceae bacterium]